MNPESQDFEQLRRLLAIKRHEQPPPGYFHHFSGDVIARIKAGDQGESLGTNWVQKLWSMLETKPVFAGAFGASVCAVLISGILNSEESETIAGAINPMVSPANNSFAPASTMALNQTSSSDPLLNANPEPSLNSLFDFNLSAQPASFSFQSGN
ncbi:MAG: hypothetical protein H7Y43_11935 [Akkermansiaceae bacterium]|nr:hypothetical protein [Verrucomicrobiales bacterium]